MSDTKTESSLSESEASISREINSLAATSLKDALGKYFASERRLNHIYSSFAIQNKALERCFYRVKGYQKIDKDLPDKIISNQAVYFIAPKFNKIRVKLAELYADILGDNISEELDAKNNYVEIKDFLCTLCLSDKISFSVKLTIFDLLLNLLKKKDHIKLDKFHKEFTPLFIFIKSLITEQKNLGIILAYLSNLGSESNEVTAYLDENILAIKKGFYSIVRDLDKDKRVIDQHLLKELSKLVNTQCNDPLKKFSLTFINKCLSDIDMTHSDFTVVIELVYSALVRSNSKPIKTVQNKLFFNKFNQAIGKKSLKDSLKEFEESFKELSKQVISSEIINFASDEKKISISTEREKFIANYFPSEESINQAKVKENFSQSLEILNLTNRVEKKSPMHYLIKTSENFKNVSDICSKITASLKVKNDLNDLNKGKDINQNSEEGVVNLYSLKVKLSNFIKNLETLENKIHPFIVNISVSEEININIENISPLSLESDCIEKIVDECIQSFQNNYSGHSQELLNQLIIKEIKQEDYWFDVNNKASLTERLFNRGYLSDNWVIKKIKSILNENMDFNKYKNFFENKSFWYLLSYGLIRWPWINKEIFAIKWAEQLCLPTVLGLKNQLLNSQPVSEEDSLGKILILSKYLDPDKIIFFNQQLMRFKQNIIMFKSRKIVLDKEIDRRIELTKKAVSCPLKSDFIDTCFFPSVESSSKFPTESPMSNFAKIALR